MQFFADTAEIEDIKKLHAMGLLDGITTNPSLIAKSGRQFKDVIKEICEIVPGPVSAEVASIDYDTMMKEGHVLAKLADNVVVKVPLTIDGLRACKTLSSEGIKTNVTLVFNPLQALLVAKAGATLVSPFVGRLDDISNDGMNVISQITQIFQNYDLSTQVLVASVRHPIHIMESALMGADIVTVPYKVMQQIVNHPLTEKGISQFLKDAQNMPK